MSMSSMSIESEDNGEFDAIATGERSDGMIKEMSSSSACT